MKRKILYMSLGAVFTLIVSFSLISLADGNTKKSDTANTSQTMSDQNTGTVEGLVSFLDLPNNKVIVFDGQKKHEFLIDGQTAIIKNNKNATIQELQLGDKIKVILNSNGNVRYLVIDQDQQTAQSNQVLTQNQVQIRSIPSDSSQTTSQVQSTNDQSNQVKEDVKQTNPAPAPAVAAVKVEKAHIEHEDHGKHKGWFKEKHAKHDEGKDKQDHENEDD
jgi:hypothetical protein